MDSYLVHHIIKKYFILFWQKIFEETVLFSIPNQIYNYHFHIKKLNRWGKFQERSLLMTNKVIRIIYHYQ